MLESNRGCESGPNTIISSYSDWPSVRYLLEKIEFWNWWRRERLRCRQSVWINVHPRISYHVERHSRWLLNTSLDRNACGLDQLNRVQYNNWSAFGFNKSLEYLHMIWWVNQLNKIDQIRFNLLQWKMLTDVNRNSGIVECLGVR